VGVATAASRAVKSVSKSVRLLAARLLRRDFYVLECRDVTEEFLTERGERLYYVEYYYRGRVHRHHIVYSGEWSPHPRVRRLQEHCVGRTARRGALGSLRALLRSPRIRGTTS
jgi:hypothetical protein